VDELSFRCGQMSVLREAANVLPVIAGIRDSVVQLVSILGSVVMSVWGMGMVQGTRRLRGERERERERVGMREGSGCQRYGTNQAGGLE
jgi:hypothetical protein